MHASLGLTTGTMLLPVQAPPGGTQRTPERRHAWHPGRRFPVLPAGAQHGAHCHLQGLPVLPLAGPGNHREKGRSHGDACGQPQGKRLVTVHFVRWIPDRQITCFCFDLPHWYPPLCSGRGAVQQLDVHLLGERWYIWSVHTHLLLWWTRCDDWLNMVRTKLCVWVWARERESKRTTCEFYETQFPFKDASQIFYHRPQMSGSQTISDVDCSDRNHLSLGLCWQN